MKIRTDYVSNSSSSSFVVIGERMDASKFDIDAFSGLGDEELYLLILPNQGSEGDYVINLTPELLMDFDMHQVDLSTGNLPIIKAKYYISDGYLYKAVNFKGLLEGDYETGWSKDNDKFNEQIETVGIECPSGCKMFRFSRDYGNPNSKEKMSVIEEVESALKFR